MKKHHSKLKILLSCCFIGITVHINGQSIVSENIPFEVVKIPRIIINEEFKNYNMHNYLVVVTQDAQEEKQFEENIILHTPRVISIGNKEYLIDFNYPAKGLRAGNYDGFIFYDLETGKTIVNNQLAVGVFSKIQDIKEVFIRSVFLQNNEIHIFAEGRTKAGSREERINPMSANTTTVDYYKFYPARQIVLDFDGKLKRVTDINVGSDEHLTNLYFSYGVVNVKGEYYINSDGPWGLYDLNSGNTMLIKIDKSMKEDVAQKNRERNSRILSGDTNNESKEYVNQLFFYIPDSKKLVLARIHSNKEMSLLSIFDPF